MLKISYAGCFGLSPAILAQFTSEMRVAARNREKFSKRAILGVQGHSRSLMLTFLRSSTPVLVMISSMSVPICNHLHIRRAHSGKITLFKGVPLFRPLVRGIPFTQRNKILSRNNRDNRLSCGENPKSLSHLVLDWYRVMMDGQTELP